MRKETKVRIFNLLLIAGTLFLSGCSGGGTEGTGIPKAVVRGNVVDSNGEALGETSLTILETGDSSTTDENGQFVIHMREGNSRLTFLIKNETLDTTAILEAIPENASQIDVKISVNVEEDKAEARLISLSTISKFKLKAEVVSSCRYAFRTTKDGLVQRQGLISGTLCNLKATVLGDGKLIGGVKVAIQRRPCKSNSEWVTAEVGITSTRVRMGTVRIPFRFYTTERACQYRVVAPFGQDNDSIDIVPIQTIQERQSK